MVIIIYNNRYTLRQGHDENHIINITNQILDGVLINKFTVQDGSFKSITTTTGQ